MELVERDTQLATLGEHLDAAVAGSGRLVLVGGEAGVGKTSLVRAFAAERGGDVRFVWGACDGLFTPQPLGPLFELAEQLGLTVEGSRREVFAATLEALRPRPTVAILEDAHWADEATLDLLRFLGRRLDRTATLMIATYRDDEVGPLHPLRVVIGDLATVDATRRISLEPLSRSGVHELAVGSQLDADELFRQTGGNPFFVTEVLAAGDAGVPASVRDAVLARAARLSPPARAVLEAAAAVGARADTALLEAALGSRPGGLEECLSAGVLAADGTVVAFRHELARRAVEEAIDPARRAGLHARLLEALAARTDVDSARLAHHAELAGDGDAALRHSAAAAEHAAGLGAHREAAEQYARALRFSGGLPSSALVELLESRARACHLTDQAEEALSVQTEALRLRRALDDPVEVGKALCELSRFAYNAAHQDKARRTAREAVELLERHPPGPQLAAAYANLANLEQIDLEVANAISLGERAIALGDARTVADALITVGIAESFAGGATDRLQQGLAAAIEENLEESVARGYGALAFVAARWRDWPAADRWLDAGLRYTADRDLDYRRLYLLGWRAQASLDRGYWEAAADDALAVLRHPHARLSRVWALLVLGQLRARRGDPGALAALDEARELIRSETPQKSVPMSIVRAETAFLEGDDCRAAEELGRLPAVALVDRCVAGKLAVWRVRLGHSPEPSGTVPEPFALELAGEHARAAAAWDRLESPYDAAMTLGASDDVADLRAGHERLLALGLRPPAAIVARKLRERGARGIPRGPRPATRAHPAGLTPRELEVVRLVEQGLRNADIAARLVISEKTVDHHVSAILGKLGVGSRADAVRAVAASEDREPAAPR